MENITALINSLNTGEQKLVRHFYKLRDFGEYKKRVQLFEAVVSGRLLDEEAAAKLVGFKTPNAAYHNVKSRLKSDIVCILLMQESSAKFNTPYAQAMFSCRRALLTGEILLSRGVYQEGLNLLRKAAKTAERFELFAERIITEDALRNHYAGSDDPNDLISGTKTIDENYRLLGKMMHSKKKLYQSIFPLHDSNAIGFTTAIVSPHEDFRDEQDIISEDSSRIRFYERLAHLNFMIKSADFDAAILFAKDLLKQVRKDPVITSASNQAGLHLELATIYLQRMEFVEAEHHANESSKLFKPGMFNSLRSNTIKLYAQVHSDNYQEATRTLLTLMSSKCLREQAHETLRYRLMLVGAWFDLACGNVQTAHARIKECAGLIKQKGVWNIGYSILECMLLVEKSAFDAALYKLDALRKIVKKNLSDPFAKRCSIAINALKTIIRYYNDPGIIRSKIKKEITLLENSSDMRWDHTGCEIIRLEQILVALAERLNRKP